METFLQQYSDVTELAKYETECNRYYGVSPQYGPVEILFFDQVDFDKVSESAAFITHLYKSLIKVPKIYETGLVENSLKSYLVMDYIEGKNLRSVVEGETNIHNIYYYGVLAGKLLKAIHELPHQRMPIRAYIDETKKQYLSSKDALVSEQSTFPNQLAFYGLLYDMEKRFMPKELVVSQPHFQAHNLIITKDEEVYLHYFDLFTIADRAKDFSSVLYYDYSLSTDYIKGFYHGYYKNTIIRDDFLDNTKFHCAGKISMNHFGNRNRNSNIDQHLVNLQGLYDQYQGFEVAIPSYLMESHDHYERGHENNTNGGYHDRL